MPFSILLKIVSILFCSEMMLACAHNKNPTRERTKNQLMPQEKRDSLKFKSGIRSILQDRTGNYWIGSDQEGLCKYDGKTFTYYDSSHGLCGKQVIYIHEDHSGIVWFGTSSGTCRYVDQKFIPLTITLRQNSWSGAQADFWLPGDHHTLLAIINGTPYSIKNPIQIPIHANWKDYGITGFSKSKTGNLWIAYYNGVAHYDGKSIQYINDSIMHYDGRFRYMHVRSILEDSKGRLWIGNNSIGVLLKEQDSIIPFSEKFQLFGGSSFMSKSPPGTLMHVFAIHEDSYGNIWFGDRDTGVWRYDGKEMKNYILDSSLNSQHIWSIYEDKNGNLLFTSGDRGVYRFNGEGFDRFL